MTEVLFLTVSEYEEERKKQGKRRLNVSGVLRILGVSRSGYTHFKKKVPSNRELKKHAIKERIREIHKDSHQNYGAPKITACLKKEGTMISEKTVGNYMRELGIKAQYIKPYTITTIDSNFNSELKNILDEKFNPSTPDAVWCSDITYIWTTKGFVYLTSIMDLYSRKIISWVLSDTLEAKWVTEAVSKAKLTRKVKSPLLLHSDRWVQYVCKEYIEATEGMERSYSKKAYPWDNACIESFYALLKREWLNRFKIVNYEQAYKLVFEYIETFYNTIRIHSHCKYLSPNNYEDIYKKQLAKMESMVA